MYTSAIGDYSRPVPLAAVGDGCRRILLTCLKVKFLCNKGLVSEGRNLAAEELSLSDDIPARARANDIVYFADLGELKVVCQLRSLRQRQVLLAVKFLLQLQQLVARERRTTSPMSVQSTQWRYCRQPQRH